MFLKELVLGLNITLWGQFLREICPFKKIKIKLAPILNHNWNPVNRDKTFWWNLVIWETFYGAKHG
jgi:hypothetical protein